MIEKLDRDVTEGILDSMRELDGKYFIPNNGSECPEDELLDLVNEKLPKGVELFSLNEIIQALDIGEPYLKERDIHFDVRHQEDGKVLLMSFYQRRYRYKGISRLIYDILVKIPVVRDHYIYEDCDIDLLVVPA